MSAYHRVSAVRRVRLLRRAARALAPVEVPTRRQAREMGRRCDLRVMGHPGFCSPPADSPAFRYLRALQEMWARGDIAGWRWAYPPAAGGREGCGPPAEPCFLVITRRREVEWHHVRSEWDEEAAMSLRVMRATFPFFRFLAFRPVPGDPGGGVERVDDA